ncbi:hypothetical protein J6590_099005 [Homalodisca vitripennis]|nr:hypothetical protein J6590_099005 [Homalodisca vitripennis]
MTRVYCRYKLQRRAMTRCAVCGRKTSSQATSMWSPNCDLQLLRVYCRYKLQRRAMTRCAVCGRKTSSQATSMWSPN